MPDTRKLVRMAVVATGTSLRHYKGSSEGAAPAALYEKMREVPDAASEWIEAGPPPFNAIEGPNGKRFPLLVDFTDRPIPIGVWGHERHRQAEQVRMMLLQPGQQIARSPLPPRLRHEIV